MPCAHSTDDRRNLLTVVASMRAAPGRRDESSEDLDAHLAAPHPRDSAARIPHLLDDSGLSVDRVRRIA